MALPQFTMRQLLEAGVHFGHQSHRWNPKMDRFIFGTRNKIHIIDLAQTVPLLHQALVTISDIVARGGRVLFVGTKRQAAEAIADSAKRSAQYFINHRWLGGMLTNWKTITNSIKRLRQLDELLGGNAQGLTKKELLQLTRERDKLEQALGGIRDMGGLPDLIFIIDTNKESIAVAEARKLSIPVVAVVDSNSNPDGIDHIIPGNDDAGRAITLYCDLVARAALDGIERAAVKGGIDIGAAVEPVAEDLSEIEPEPEPAAAGLTPGAEAEAAPASGFKPLSAPEGDADDLTKLSGVGKSWAGKLNEQGIYHFWQIAALTPEELEALDEALNAKGKIVKSGWIEEAGKFKEQMASEAAA
jgi:small subunit ribosomal protein S2